MIERFHPQKDAEPSCRRAGGGKELVFVCGVVVCAEAGEEIGCEGGGIEGGEVDYCL